VEKGTSGRDRLALLRPFFAWFDRGSSAPATPTRAGQRILERKRASSRFAVIVAAMVFLYWRMPTGYSPTRTRQPADHVQLRPFDPRADAGDHEPDRGPLPQRTEDAVESIGSISGWLRRSRAEPGAGVRQAQGLDLRKRPDLKVTAVAAKAIASSPRSAATIFAFPPPAVTELGVATGST